MTPPTVGALMNDDTATHVNYPISQHINIGYSAFEDRLVVTAQRAGNAGPVTMLVSRRMVLLILKNILNKLPELTGLEKTPANYWREVLQMAHQHAMEAKAQTDQKRSAKARQEKAADAADSATDGSADDSAGHAAATDDKPEAGAAASDTLFLATELTLNTVDTKLTLAFRGLPMPHAMVNASAHQPIFALPLQVDNVHQLIELLIEKCEDAQWHLPVELPWLDVPDDSRYARKDSLPTH